MDDSILIEFIQHFDEIPLSNDDFEFPDLLGVAYEYLIKYFADSAGKKGGEIYTPEEVVRMMVHVLEPQAGMSVCDPCAGSGGMMIQSRQYVEEVGGNARDLSLAGQKLNGGTWAVYKMNMILYGIRSADIRQGWPLTTRNCDSKLSHEVVSKSLTHSADGDLLLYRTGSQASIAICTAQSRHLGCRRRKLQRDRRGRQPSQGSGRIIGSAGALEWPVRVSADDFAETFSRLKVESGF